ncbi:MAG: phosphodiester glycosidase family protein [Anaerolineae bacterium]|nr:phosphodiester glycosidase family protein [Anaerolineae bacterium]
MTAWYIAASLTGLALSSWLIRKSSDLRHTFARPSQIISGGALLLVVGSLIVPRILTFAYGYRPTPENTRETLFEGIDYIREVRSRPRPLVIHVVRIDLGAPGISFLVTPPDALNGRQLQAITTSQFLSEYGLQIAVNGDFFEPWRDVSPLDYYPHLGDPVDVWGFAASEGVIYSHGSPNHPALYIASDNTASFDEPVGTVYNAISGNRIFVREGKPYQMALTESYHQNLHPRTSIALDEAGQTLIIVLVDGRQWRYSEGVTMAELAEIVIQHGGYTALNFDGGGSTDLVIADRSGQPIVLNAPIHNHIPYRERPVGNHLGVYASAADD